MTRFISFLMAAFFSSPLLAQTSRPVPGIDRVLIISIDGLRPDVLLRADTPNMHTLFHNGSFTFWARTTAQSITLPSHVSMLTGVVPEVHAILWNSDMPFSEPVYPAVPTLFELAKKAGLTTALVAGKNKFVVFDKPGALDWKYISKVSRPPTKKLDGTFDAAPPPDPRADSIVTEHAVAIINEHKPQVMFVHLAGVDNFGHAMGWGSAPQLQAVSEADRCIGLILTALSDSGFSDSTLVIVTSDHGGSGRTHGPEDTPSRTIPWIISGPHVRRDLDLTLMGHERNIETFDTFATACAVLGLHPPATDPVVGRFVSEAFDTGEMLTDTYEPKMVPATTMPDTTDPSTTPSDTMIATTMIATTTLPATTPPATTLPSVEPTTAPTTMP